MVIIMDQSEQKHKRRVRYSGTHPKSFQEKRQPERMGLNGIFAILC